MLQDWFLQLIKIGIGCQVKTFSKQIDWEAIEVLAVRHGLLPVIYDAVQKLPEGQRPPLETWLRWIGQVVLEEQRFAQQWKASCEMAQVFAQNGIRTYVLKGMVVSECYPKPQHRVSADVDCFLADKDNIIDVWEKGNKVMEEAGYKVERGFYKNSSFTLPGVMVENHKYMVPFRGNERLKKLERWLQEQFNSLSGSRFEGTELWRPPVMVSALFLIEHAYSHFLHEGLTWRHVLDWEMFCRKHNEEIDWCKLDELIDEFGFRKFYDAYVRMGQLLLGEINETAWTKPERKMLDDVWAPLDLHETLEGVKGKLGLVGNTLRAGWKYRYFSPISMPHALWIQVKGFLFDKNPTL